MTTIETHTGTMTLGAPRVGTGIIDVDIHPLPQVGLVDQYLPAKWRDHMREYGVRTTNGLQSIGEYPQMYGGAMRADAWPDSGMPGSDLGLIRKQLLDLHDVELGVLQCLSPGGQTLNPASQALNPELGAALCSAINDWQLEHLVYPEPRLRAAMAVTIDCAEFAVREIQRVGNDPGVVAILGLSKTLEPLGSRRYWPLYEAAIEAGLPFQFHLSTGGGNPNTGTGWTSYHPEYHVAHVQSFQSQILSLILSGTLDRFPDLRVMFVEGNVAHFAPLLARLDYHWSTLRNEVPDLQRKPSEYIRDHIWASTQPMDEPDNPVHLAEMVEEFCADNVLYASDYPHFDFDDPDTVFPRSFSEELRTKILRTNGKRFFQLDQEISK
jgi:predicted TIM-barrel fold metal-dependent hydrolase